MKAFPILESFADPKVDAPVVEPNCRIESDIEVALWKDVVPKPYTGRRQKLTTVILIYSIQYGGQPNKSDSSDFSVKIPPVFGLALWSN